MNFSIYSYPLSTLSLFTYSRCTTKYSSNFLNFEYSLSSICSFFRERTFPAKNHSQSRSPTLHRKPELDTFNIFCEFQNASFYFLLSNHPMFCLESPGSPHTKKKASENRKPYRADWIRTNDLLNPIQALYQTELQPATRASVAKIAKKSPFCKSSFANNREWAISSPSGNELTVR